jgi:hypothetical protein
MSQILAYGFELTASFGDVDTSNIDDMKKFLGKDTGLLYLNEKLISKIHGSIKLSKEPVVFVTCYHRDIHGFSYHLVMTQSIVATDKMGKLLPRAVPYDWDTMLVSEYTDMAHNARSVMAAAKSGGSCSVSNEGTSPQWVILDSDD